MVFAVPSATGFDVVAEALQLADRIASAALVVTGEGFLDEQSFRGKAVGGVTELAREAGVPVLVVVGDVYVDDLPEHIDLPRGDVHPTVRLINRVGFGPKPGQIAVARMPSSQPARRTA